MQMPWKLMSVHKALHISVYSSFILNCQTLKQPKCSTVGEWINKLWHIHAVEYYSVMKRNELSSHKTHGGILNIYTSKGNKPVLKGYKLYDSNYVSFWGWQNYHTVKRSMVARHFWLSAEGWVGGEKTIQTDAVWSCNCPYVTAYMCYNCLTWEWSQM